MVNVRYRLMGNVRIAMISNADSATEVWFEDTRRSTSAGRRLSKVGCMDSAGLAILEIEAQQRSKYSENRHQVYLRLK